MSIANLILSLSTCLLGLIYKNSLEHQMEFVSRLELILKANNLVQVLPYTEDIFHVICLVVIVVPLGLAHKSFRFTHFWGGLALMLFNTVLNLNPHELPGKYFLMLTSVSVGLMISGTR